MKIFALVIIILIVITLTHLHNWFLRIILNDNNNKFGIKFIVILIVNIIYSSLVIGLFKTLSIWGLLTFNL